MNVLTASFEGPQAKQTGEPLLFVYGRVAAPDVTSEERCVCFSFCPASVNVLVPNCKIYNDASCDISADGQLLAVFIPSSQRGFPDEGILAIYSLAPHNLGEMLYTKRFGTVTL